MHFACVTRDPTLNRNIAERYYRYTIAMRGASPHIDHKPTRLEQRRKTRGAFERDVLQNYRATLARHATPKRLAPQKPR